MSRWGTPSAGPPGSCPPTVIYIAGSGRSGSTLLERVLGEMPDFVNVGELIDLFRRTAARGERCGCGLAFADCPFWKGVGQHAFSGWDGDQLASMHRLQSRVARQRHLARLVAMRLADRRFRADLARYGASYDTLYRAIAAESGSRYVVDASKWPVQALALARAGLDVRVIHLVRDLRVVAYSLNKQVARPHALGPAENMLHHVPAEAAGRWLAIQGEAELLRRCGLPVTRMRYEDFVRQPRESVMSALRSLGLPADAAQLAHVGGTRVVLGPSHGLSGNPSRFRDGTITLHADEAWRTRMSRRDRFIITTIGLPLLLRYRWRLSTRPQPGAMTTASQVPVPAAAARWPLVSVIVPTHGRPALVREAIAAVVAQDYPGDIECIVVHDQEPPDEELTRLGSPGRQIQVTANVHSAGLAGARNTGLDLATGPYIATCDDDDTWHPGKLRAQIGRLLSQPDLLVVGSGIRLMLPGGKTLDWPGRAEQVSYRLLLRNRVKELHSSTLVMRREAFDEAGRYDERLPFGYAEDYDWVLRAARTRDIGIVAQPLANIRKDAPSYYRGAAERAGPALEYMLAKHPDFAMSRRGHARMLGQLAFARSSLGERGPATRYALKAITRWPASPYPYIALAHSATGVHPRHVLRAARLFRRGMA
jgi:hypothetical protein